MCRGFLPISPKHATRAPTGHRTKAQRRPAPERDYVGSPAPPSHQPQRGCVHPSFINGSHTLYFPSTFSATYPPVLRANGPPYYSLGCSPPPKAGEAPGNRPLETPSTVSAASPPAVAPPGPKLFLHPLTQTQRRARSFHAPPSTIYHPQPLPCLSLPTPAPPNSPLANPHQRRKFKPQVKLKSQPLAILGQTQLWPNVC